MPKYLGLLVALLVISANVSAEEAKKQPRIVNGNFETISNVPWQLLIESSDGSGTSVCGGFLISKEYALTAAHCMDGVEASQVTIYAGLEDLENRTASNTLYASQVLVFPNYDRANFVGDLALIRISGTLPDSAKPIVIDLDAQYDLDTEIDANQEDNLYVSGWGATYNDGPVSRFLRHTILTGVSDLECGWNYDDNEYVPLFGNATICANQPSVTTGVCSGDSGGALVWRDPSHASDSDMGYRAVGIVSFSDGFLGCGSTQSEDGFTQISTYMDWINNNISGGYTAPTVSFSGDIFDVTDNYTPPTNVAPTTPSIPAGSQGGGGSLGVLSLLVMLVGLFGRRRTIGL